MFLNSDQPTLTVWWSFYSVRVWWSFCEGVYSVRCEGVCEGVVVIKGGMGGGGGWGGFLGAMYSVRVWIKPAELYPGMVIVEPSLIAFCSRNIALGIERFKG
ncbi:hypothetical protein DPMN_060035 [Dreissena polymorpha]|uniref:Uncharacterized protein n=1 Tax=Dreissena polymorpha TaxID=45954 RepID=A0A9D4C566_DREPO|nr:hypothetical protein DPMN_060035 [Dreissena polymorpha]